MVTKHSSKRQERRQKAADATGGSRQGLIGEHHRSPVSERIRAAIEEQRRTLQMADSALGCLVTALEYSSSIEPRQRPDYSDAARAVRRMVAAAIDRLDSVNLKRAAAEMELSP